MCVLTSITPYDQSRVKKKINSIDVTTSFDNNNYCVLRVIYNVWCASVGIKRIENALCNNMCICIILTI